MNPLCILALAMTLLVCPAYLYADAPSAAQATEATPDDSFENDEDTSSIPDPLEPLNIAMFNFNDRLYFWVLKPAAQAYSSAVPEDFRVIFSNLYDNLWSPSRILNNALQLRFRSACNELIRFLFNSTVGIVGLGDASGDILSIKKQDADFGQTLGRYGAGHGIYLVLPVFGPSSIRDGLGLAADWLMHPLTHVSSHDLSLAANAGIYTHEKVNYTSFRIGDYESFKESAIDPYLSMRDAFVQHRKKKVEESRERE